MMIILKMHIIHKNIFFIDNKGLISILFFKIIIKKEIGITK